MKKIPVFYNEEMVVIKPQSSPSPRKPAEVVKQWQDKFLIEIKDFNKVSIEQIKKVHDNNFVDKIMSAKLANGFGSKDQEVINSLPYTSGSFLAAAKEALKSSVAVSPTSGFHHAEYNKAMGYCTFNGLMIAAVDLLDNKLVNKIAILDCDQHYGNGTDNIINKLNLNNNIIHITAKADYPYNSKDFFKLLPLFLANFKQEKIDILFYQAGADCHKNDPCCGFLDTEEMKKRDEIVFHFCKKNNIPIVWNLAGGYQEDILENGDSNIQKVLDLHNNTMERCQDIYLNEL